VVADGGEPLAGAGGAEADLEGAEDDGAVGGDGEAVDGGVVLGGQVAGAAEGRGSVPGPLRGAALVVLPARASTDTSGDLAGSSCPGRRATAIRP
jgi:hypothetical protein